MSLEDFLYFIIFPILSLSIILVFVRFIQGPTIADRIVAVDLLVTIGIGVTAVFSILSNQPTFLDIALIFGLIAFLGSIAYSTYLEKRKKK